MPRRPASQSFARRFGARVRTLRVARGLTQEQLAWSCDFAKAFLSQIESGKRMPSLPALFAIAGQLEVAPADMLNLDSDAKPSARAGSAPRETSPVPRGRRSGRELASRPNPVPSPLDDATVRRRVGIAVAQQRRLGGLTREQLAARIDTPVEYVRRVEAGREDLTLSALVRLANALRSRLSDLTGGVDERATDAPG